MRKIALPLLFAPTKGDEMRKKALIPPLFHKGGGTERPIAFAAQALPLAV